MKEWTEEEIDKLLADIKDAIYYTYHKDHAGSSRAWKNMHKAYDTLDIYFRKWKDN